MLSRAKQGVSQFKAQSYNRQITFQKPVDANTDTQGGEAITWTALYTCWCNLQSLPRGRQLVRPYFALQLYPMATKLISIRWMSDFEIDATLRIQYIKSDKTHIYQILGVDNIEEANVELLMYCTEWQARGSS
jgi:head-tail adaptor